MNLGMRKFYLIFFTSIFAFAYTQQFKKANNFFFYENKGQIIDQFGKPNSAVKYLFNSNGLNVQIRKDGFSYDVFETEKITDKPKESRKNLGSLADKKSIVRLNQKFHRIDINL